MTETHRWEPLGPDLESILAAESDPLLALSEGRVPAIICRQAYSSTHCQGLIGRFIDRGLMRDPNDAEAALKDNRTRIDIGTSLANRGSDKEAFLSHAEGTRALYETLFEGYDDPVKLLYGVLDTLAGEKRAMTAQEPDGRQYGPAIFRIPLRGPYLQTPHRPRHAPGEAVRLRRDPFRTPVRRGPLLPERPARGTQHPGHPAPVHVDPRGAGIHRHRYLPRLRPAQRRQQLHRRPRAGRPLLLQHPPHPRGPGRGGRPAAHRPGHLHRIFPRRPGSLRLVVMCQMWHISCTIVQLFSQKDHNGLTTKPIPVIDIFSGPGGLAEGFAGCRNEYQRSRYRVVLSVESDEAAVRTLRLRAFLRTFADFPRNLPSEYYDFLNGFLREQPDWSKLYRDNWEQACDEVMQCTLGNPETEDSFRRKIQDLRAQYGDRTVLVGGPPCQAYSLAGRARVAGIQGYTPVKDPKFKLYKKYVEVLAELQPAVAILENVKGILSSKIEGTRIFSIIEEELRSAGGSQNYELHGFTSQNDTIAGLFPNTNDYVVRAEEHGIPQARHRVFVVCLRADIAKRFDPDTIPRLLKTDSRVTVNDVIGNLPAMRSRLSRGDSFERWHQAVRDGYHEITRSTSGLVESLSESFMEELAQYSTAAKEVPDGTAFEGVTLPETCPAGLRNWIHDNELKKLPNNETRSHMSGDLARYLFAALFGIKERRSPTAMEFPSSLAPDHKNWFSGKFSDRYRVQVSHKPSSTITSHISKDGHYFIHPDPRQCRSLTVREAARLQTFPDNYYFEGNRTEQYVQVGNAVPPYLALQIARSLLAVFDGYDREFKPEAVSTSDTHQRDIAQVHA